MHDGYDLWLEVIKEGGILESSLLGLVAGCRIVSGCRGLQPSEFASHTVPS
jgi:hypothetical protein